MLLSTPQTRPPYASHQPPQPYACRRPLPPYACCCAPTSTHPIHVINPLLALGISLTSSTIYMSLPPSAPPNQRHARGQPSIPLCLFLPPMTPANCVVLCTSRICILLPARLTLSLQASEAYTQFIHRMHLLLSFFFWGWESCASHLICEMHVEASVGTDLIVGFSGHQAPGRSGS